MFRVPNPVPRHLLTRRQTLALGAAAVAAGGARPAAAARRRGPSAFELALDDPAGAIAAGWHTTRVYAAPRRFDLIGLRWARGSHADAQVRARRRGGGWTPWVPLHAAGDHGPDGARAPAGTEPAWTGSADLFQLRLRGRPRGLRARFVRSAPGAATARRRAARTGRAAARAGRRPGDHSPGGVGRRRRSAPQRAVLRPGAGRVRPPHRDRKRLRTHRFGGHRARHRALPPRPQRVERRGLQLPRRPVRPDLRGPRGRDRPGDRRRPDAGLQLASPPASRASARSPPSPSPRRGWTRWRG